MRRVIHCPKRPRVALAGSVNSSLATLKKLVAHDCRIVSVLGLDPAVAHGVSGYQDIVGYSSELGLPARYFKKLNSPEVADALRAAEVDILFVVGLSQMVREPLLSIARVANVGFHPTCLPKGRGRGAIAWSILGFAPPGATFFVLDAGVDSGPVWTQCPVTLSHEDYASDLIRKVVRAAEQCLDAVLPAMNEGAMEVEDQDDRMATYLGVRRQADGLIVWDRPAVDVQRLVRAVSEPLPGAFTRADGVSVRIWRAQVRPHFTGVPGRVVAIEDDRPVVACGEGSIWVESWNADDRIEFRVGQDLK